MKEFQTNDYSLLNLLYPEWESLEAKDILVVHAFECAYLLAFKNKVTYVTDDIEMARKFDEEVINNFAFGFDDKVYYVTDWNKVDYGDLESTCATDIYSSVYDVKEKEEVKDDDAWLNALNEEDYE